MLDAQLAAERGGDRRGARRARQPPSSIWSYTTITATQDGVLGQRQVKPGQLVGVGHPDHDAHAAAERLGHRQLQGNAAHPHGGRAEGARSPSIPFPATRCDGHVQAFAPASGAEFALLPPDNATGNFTKVVQRIAVKIVIDDADGLPIDSCPGMSVEARIDARDGKR